MGCYPTKQGPVWSCPPSSIPQRRDGRPAHHRPAELSDSTSDRHALCQSHGTEPHGALRASAVPSIAIQVAIALARMLAHLIVAQGRAAHQVLVPHVAIQVPACHSPIGARPRPEGTRKEKRAAGIPGGSIVAIVAGCRWVSRSLLNHDHQARRLAWVPRCSLHSSPHFLAISSLIPPRHTPFAG